MKEDKCYAYQTRIVILYLCFASYVYSWIDEQRTKPVRAGFRLCVAIFMYLQLLISFQLKV